ncbi:flagellar biosynthesis anti-sigma factor FlgM [Plesiomonas shigelloides subsp. oncorhynchi]|nr:flagellar biosynthesis anti-sigma factor FlgM [Plesiomonas shigelloides]KAB7685007.1 flagellar biosynthesis anti-sigma factor FlgM [Plesiomonas shigelloides]KAB7697166.1 flagellar biosynthesis anti-sigma factor FlgM [Plesiomonas shigelloides]KAB7709448.1 flagellar biosynthesis anti-sigma factor FlgM [Plesiomonas shigelloides]MDA1381113.1 flagellar biosynthesis anti-sigma factor FlgM [Plesiomonas shigelloides]
MPQPNSRRRTDFTDDVKVSTTMMPTLPNAKGATMIGKVQRDVAVSSVLTPASGTAQKTPAANSKPVESVALSRDLKMLEQAQQTPRPAEVDLEKVAKMRALLAQGGLSINTDRLADSLYQHYKG